MPDDPPAANRTKLPTLVHDLIPHGNSIRMVDQLTQVEDEVSRSIFAVTAESPFVDESGILDETAYIEMIAQSFAATHGYHLTPAERAEHRGLLIGVKDLVITGRARVGDRLEIIVRKVAKFGDFGVVDGDVKNQNGELLATGQIKVWRPGEDSGKDVM